MQNVSTEIRQELRYIASTSQEEGLHIPGVPVQVVGVLYVQARETYYPEEYALLVADIGQEAALTLAQQAGWNVGDE
jgi:hypothetical protein